MQTVLERPLVLSKDNPFKASVWLFREVAGSSTEEPAAGLTVTMFIARTRGGAAIDTTEVGMTEYGDDPGGYRGELAGTVANTVLALGLARYWLCIYRTGSTLRIWVPIPVERDRTAT